MGSARGFLIFIRHVGAAPMLDGIDLVLGVLGGGGGCLGAVVWLRGAYLRLVA